MQKKPSLRSAITRYKRTRISNSNHHARVLDVLSGAGDTKKRMMIVKRRSAQLRRLEKIPMFNRILSRRERVSFSVGEKAHSVVLFKNGFVFEKNGPRFVVLLDEKLRGLLLMDVYNPNRPEMKWTPFKLFKSSKGPKGVRNLPEPFPIGSWGKFFLELSNQIESRERNIKFNAVLSARQIKRIRKFI